MEKKKRLVPIAIIGVIIILWFTGIIPKQIAKVSGTNYVNWEAIPMKKIVVMVLCVIIALSMVGCGNQVKYSDSSITETNTYPNVSLELHDDTIINGLLTLTLNNNNDFDIESGNQYDFAIEAFHEDKWKSIDVGERDNTSDACIYFKGKHLIQFGVSEVYGELPSGHYRLVKCFWPENEGIDAKFYLSVEFDVE